MKKIMIILSVLVLILSVNVEATTKQDILDFVNAQTVGDSQTAVVFNSYKTTFTRLLKQKNLTSEECDKILSYLNTAVGILNSNEVTKLSDMSKLTAEEKSLVYNSLTSGASIITNAPTIGSTTNEGNTEGTNTGENSSNKTDAGNTTVNINTTDGTMDIYENGILVDKIPTKANKLTYTGPSSLKICIIITSACFGAIASVMYVILAKRRKTRVISIIKTLLLSIIICTFLVIIVILVFNKYIARAEELLAMIKFEESTDTIDIKLNEKNEIERYPSYGNSYATLLIESLGIEKSIVYGDDTTLLTQNICQASWSDFPTENGLTVLSGHNKEGMLKNISKISIGETVVIDATYAKCIYEVYKTEIIEDTDFDALKKDENVETVIIYTCYPFSEYIYGVKRFAVYAKLVNVEWK